MGHELNACEPPIQQNCTINLMPGSRWPIIAVFYGTFKRLYKISSGGAKKFPGINSTSMSLENFALNIFFYSQQICDIFL